MCLCRGDAEVVRAFNVSVEDGPTIPNDYGVILNFLPSVRLQKLYKCCVLLLFRRAFLPMFAVITISDLYKVYRALFSQPIPYCLGAGFIAVILFVLYALYNHDV